MKKGILGFVTAVMVLGLSTITCFAATGTVTAGTAKIREKASTDSSVVASTAKGAKIDIVGAEKDSSGTVWYKVPVAGGSYGYVRSDLVQTSDTISVTTDNSQASSTSTSTSSESKPEATVPTAIGEQAATVKCDSNVKVRAGASTKHDVVTSLPNGTAITLIGEANDSAGNKWYQLRCEYNGKTVEGYIRSDLIAIGSNTTSADGTDTADTSADGTEVTDGSADGTDGTEGENPDESQTEEIPAEEPEPEHNDYEVVYMADTENPDTGKYYLYNNIDGTMADVEVLFSSVTTANDNVAKLEAESSQKNIIIIILAVVIVLLFIGLTILIIKLKGAYEYDYDEEEEEEEEEEFEEPAPRRRIREEPVEEYERPRRQERSPRPSREEEDVRPARRERGREEAPEREGRPARNSSAERQGQPQKRQPESGEGTVKRAPRKAQNFLADDDEFEFEFLNMDDKDL